MWFLKSNDLLVDCLSETKTSIYEDRKRSYGTDSMIVVIIHDEKQGFKKQENPIVET